MPETPRSIHFPVSFLQAHRVCGAPGPYPFDVIEIVDRGDRAYVTATDGKVAVRAALVTGHAKDDAVTLRFSGDFANEAAKLFGATSRGQTVTYTPGDPRGTAAIGDKSTPILPSREYWPNVANTIAENCNGEAVASYVVDADRLITVLTALRDIAKQNLTSTEYANAVRDGVPLAPVRVTIPRNNGAPLRLALCGSLAEEHKLSVGAVIMPVLIDNETMPEGTAFDGAHMDELGITEAAAERKAELLAELKDPCTAPELHNARVGLAKVAAKDTSGSWVPAVIHGAGTRSRGASAEDPF